MKGEDFVNDVLMYGALCSCIGEEEAMKLRKRFTLGELPEDLEEVTIAFPDYFPISKIKPDALKKKEKKANTGFDAVAFHKELMKLGLAENALMDEEVETIGKLAALYHLDEKTMASYVAECLTVYRSGRARLNQKQLEQKCQQTVPFSYLRPEQAKKSDVSGDSLVAQQIALADSVTALQFLSYLQNGHKPASADVKLVQRLSVEIGLPDPVISILLSYALQMNDNILSSSYCEKVGASLQRAGCQTARDAVDYLYKSSKRKKKKPSPVVTDEPVSPKEEAVVEPKEDVDALLDDLFKDEEDDKK